mmetsp:Transcript_50890/g.140862  ORF Transcript_50890/g.140862 Transcript_50890/m.140862 type:complete len:188 (+) Transcript_50890:11-574(+)
MLLVSVAVGAFNVGMGPRAEVAHRAPRVVAVEPSAAIDMASLDPTVLGGAAAVVLGGAALAFSNKGDSAPAPAPAPPAPAPAPSPVVSTPVVYVPVGGTAGPHRMAGTMPPPPVRELWTPPPGWKPPSPPAKVVVASWYDTGMRLTGSVVPTGDAYAAKKAAYDARRLVLLPPTGANKPKQEKAAAK